MKEMLRNKGLDDRSALCWFVLATLLAMGLRLYQLEKGSFWLDELFTITGSAQLEDMHYSKALGYVPTVLGLRAAGIHPGDIPPEPATWQSMGITERIARWPTAILGILSIPIIGLACVRLIGTRAAIIAALLLAVAPWHIYWSQAARFYIPQFLFYSLCLIYYYIATRDRSRGYFAAAMACMVLAFLSQPTALVILGVFAVDWLIAAFRKQPLLLGWYEWTVGCVAVTFCAVLLVFDITSAPASWTHFVTEDTRHQSPLRMLVGAAFMIGPAVLVIAGATALAMWTRQSRLMLYLLIAGVLPIVVFAAMSNWAFVGLRYSFVALFPWLALVGFGAVMMHRALTRSWGMTLAWTPVALVFAATGFLTYLYFNSEGNYHARWRDAAEYVLNNRSDDDIVAASDPYLASYYIQGSVDALPASRASVAELKNTTWFIIEVNHVNSSSGRHWAMQDAELVELYPLRLAHGMSIVQVYRFVPDVNDSDNDG